MSTVKGLKLTRNLAFGIGKIFHKGEYTTDIPEELLAEFQTGSPYITEIGQIPSVKTGSVEAAKDKIEEQPEPLKEPEEPEEPKKVTTAKKTTTAKRGTKTTRGAKTTAKK